MFVGRETELKHLQDLFKKRSSSLVTCRGRRRVGKSTLIRAFARKSAGAFYEFQGLPPREGISTRDQLDNFAMDLSRQTGMPKFNLDNWPQAFSLLAKSLKKEKTVVLLDEISWMAGAEKDFAGYLKIAWDTELKEFDRLILVLCGSVSSWIDENILNNTGFVGRVSLQIDLKPLSLYHANRFWGDRVSRISSLEKLKVLSVTGGVPKYLEEVRPQEPAEDNIKRLCFNAGGILFSEFTSIFNAIFSRRAPIYSHIVRMLTSRGKSLSDIARELGKQRSGSLSRYLSDLCASGFVSKDRTYHLGTRKPSRLHRYRISDNYLRFYLNYIEPLKDNIKAGMYHTVSLDRIVRWDVILGLQFENLVLGNVPTVLKILDIDPAIVLSASPWFQQATARHKACQIDLLIQTRHTIYVCEIKCRTTIDRRAIEQTQAKIDALNIPRRYSVRPVLIYEGALGADVSREGYFDALVSFESILNRSPPA